MIPIIIIIITSYLFIVIATRTIDLIWFYHVILIVCIKVHLITKLHAHSYCNSREKEGGVESTPQVVTALKVPGEIGLSYIFIVWSKQICFFTPVVWISRYYTSLRSLSHEEKILNLSTLNTKTLTQKYCINLHEHLYVFMLPWW